MTVATPTEIAEWAAKPGERMPCEFLDEEGRRCILADADMVRLIKRLPSGKTAVIRVDLPDAVPHVGHNAAGVIARMVTRPPAVAR